MEDEGDPGSPPPSDDAPLCYLRKCFKAARDVFVDAMKTEAVQKLQARLQKLELVERDLRGFMYLSPNKMPEFRADELEERKFGDDHICAPHHAHMNMWIKTRIIHHPVQQETSLRVSMRKCGEVWKLKNSLTLGDHRLQVTVKKMGSDNWTPVEFFPYPGGTPEDGTDFTHGDQLDVSCTTIPTNVTLP